MFKGAQCSADPEIKSQKGINYNTNMLIIQTSISLIMNEQAVLRGTYGP